MKNENPDIYITEESKNKVDDINEEYDEFDGTFNTNMMTYNQPIDISRSPNRAAIYSYCKDAKNPILFRHYIHWHGDLAGFDGYEKRIHDYCKIYIFIEGKFNMLIEDNLCAPVCGNVITVRNEESSTSFFYALSNLDYYEIDFPPEFFDVMPKDSPFYNFFFDRETGQSNLITLGHQAMTKLFQTLEKIETLIGRKPDHSDFLIYSRLIQMCALVSDAFTNNKSEASDHKISHTLKTALQYISGNYLTLIDTKKIAEHCHISVSYLCRLFKNSLGTTPIEYINSQKLSHAKYMLKNGHNVTETCYASGFNSYNYFISTFKKNVGQTPTEFKKSEN